MKKFTKHLLFTLITVIILTITFVISASAETYSGTCGDNVSWSLNTKTGEIIIKGNGAIEDNTNKDNVPWYPYISYIETVTISDGIISIGDYAFYECDMMTSLTLPNSLTNIGNYAFDGCSSLTQLTIPDNVVAIGDHAFSYCSRLKSVNIGNGVEKIGDYAFNRCKVLSNITMGDNIQSIGNYAFYYCTDLPSIEIPNGVTSIGEYTFSYCSNLTSITIPDSVKNIGVCAFINCSKLTKVLLGDGITAISTSMFSTCKNLSNIIIPNSVASIGTAAFSNCSSLKTVTIGNSVKSIGKSAFYKCTGLTSINIPGNVKSICDSAFYGCSGLTSITMGNGIKTIENNSFYECSKLISVKIPNSVTSIGEYSFYACYGLTDVTIGDGVTSIGSYAFYDCRNLINVSIGKNVKTICDYAFNSCLSLKNVIIPNSLENIGFGAFYWCESLESISIPFVGNGSDKTYFSYIFGSSDYLNSILVPNTLKTVIITDETCIADYAFYYCSDIESVIMPNSVTSIGNSAFSYCLSLTNIKIPASVESIGNGAFESCSAFTSLTIPNGVKSIGKYAFYNCSALTEATISSSVLSIDSFAFEICDNLKTVYLYENSYADTYFNNIYSYEIYLGRFKIVYITSIIDTDVLVPSEDDEPEEYKYSFKVMDIEDETPICNASITLGGMSAVTDDKGMASFKTSEEETVTMSVSAEDYIDVEFEGYKIGGKNALEIIGMMKEKEDAILPISCNGTPISTTAAQINNKADLYASIIVKGTSSSKIIGYKLKQGSKLLAESSGGSFTVKNSSFKKSVPVTAYAYTEEGKEISKTLNINVISFDLIDPSFNLSGESVKIPGNIELFGGMEIKFELNEKVDIEFEISNYEIKVGLNMQVAEKDLSKLNGGLRKWMDSHDRKTPSAKAGFKVGGYVLIELGNYGIKDIKADIVLTLEYTNGFCKTYILSVPVRVEVECGVSGKFTITAIGYDFENSKLLYPSLEGTASGSVTASAGIGNWLASAGVYGKLGIEIAMNILPDFMVDTIKALGEIGVYAKAKLLGEIKLKIIDGELVLYNGNTAKVSSISDSLDLYDTESYCHYANEYLSSSSIWNKTSDGILQSDVYDMADPQAVTAGNVTLMAYISDSGSGDAYNRSQLVYSVCTASGWSSPIPVDSNTNADSEFDLYSDGKDIWIAYTEAKRTLTAEDEAEDIAGTIELTVMKYNTNTGTFTSPTILTSNDTMESTPVITVIDGIPAVAWVNNSENNIFGMSSNNSIYMSEYKKGSWSTPTAIASEVSAITDIDIGSLGGQLCIAAIHDSDNDFGTSDDSILTVYNVDGSSYSYEKNSCRSVLFDSDILYWYNTGSIYSASEIGEAVLVSDALSADSAADFDIVTKDSVKYILYRLYNTEGENGGSDIYALINSGSGWSQPVRLTETDGYIDSFDALIRNSELVLLYRKTEVTFTESDFETYCELWSDVITPTVSLTIQGIEYDQNDLFGDSTVSLKITVKNEGLKNANSFKIALGGITKKFTDGLEAGKETEVEIVYTLTEGESAEVILTDENGKTFTEEAPVYYYDFEAHAETEMICGTYYINATVRNKGNIGGSGTIYIKRDDANGSIIYSEEAEFGTGDQKYILLEIIDETLEDIYIEFVPSGNEEYFEYDNYCYASIFRFSSVIYGDSNSDGAVDSKDAVLLAQYLAKWNVEIDENGADCNADGSLDSKDAVLLAQYLAKWNVVLG